MKRLSSLVLSFVLMLTFAIPAFAADEQGYPMDLAQAIADGVYSWELSEDGSYYALMGVVYCAHPAEDATFSTSGASGEASDEASDETSAEISAADEQLIETMNVYVPAAYFEGGMVNGYTADTAPVVYHQECGGWRSSKPGNVDPEYIENGFIHVYVGVRSRDAGQDSETGEYLGKSPIQAIDMKAALRFLRYNEAALYGDMDRVFSVGGSGGGQMSSIFGASGNMEAYYPGLYAIGACGIEYDASTDTYTSTISDAPYGCMCYCPIADINNADLAYAWMRWDSGDVTYGRTELSEFKLALQDDLAIAFCEYINELGLTNENGESIGFDTDEKGEIISPRQGSYYGQMLINISDALNQCAANTDAAELETLLASYTDKESWLVDNGDNTYTVTDLAGFVNGTGLARGKNIPGFDTFGRTAENDAFGTNTERAVHFSASVAEVLEENYEYYSTLEGFEDCDVDDYIAEASRTDIIEQTYLMNATHILVDGVSEPAVHWRTRNGTADQHTSFAIAYDLCMAALSNEDVESVDYSLVWNMGHGSNEGTTTGSFVSWINGICQ